MLARPTAHRGSMDRPVEPRQHRDLFQEGQIPVGTAFLLGIALGRAFCLGIALGLGFFPSFDLVYVGRTGNAREQF